jgi:hypothetical protein
MSVLSFRLSLSAPLVAGALALSVSSLWAQGSGGTGGFSGARGAGGTVVAREHPTIPAATIRAVIGAHHPDVAAGTSDANILTLMMDSNGNYVGSAATKASVVARVAPSGENTVTATGGARGSGSGAGGFVTASPTGGAGPVAGTATATISPVGTPGAGKMTFAGIGDVDASLVQDIFSTSYEAGEVAPNALRVRFVILKNGVPK